MQSLPLRSILLAAAAALLAAPALAQAPGVAPAAVVAPAGAYTLDRTHASLTWKAVHQGLAWYNARFTDFNIDLTFDPADVTKSKVSVTVDPKSVETDFAKTRPAGNTTDFNKEVATDARFLNGDKFPKITFVSKSITKTGDKTGKMTGDLTFLGVTKPATFDITYVGNRNDPRSQKHKVGFAATGSIKRSDFGMGAGPLADEVKLEIDAEFVQK